MKRSRTLNQTDLFDESPIFQDVYFAIDKQGWGRVFDNNTFCGIARPKQALESNEYIVTIYGRLCPEGNFRRRTYRSQDKANKALIRYAEKALQEKIRSDANQ